MKATNLHQWAVLARLGVGLLCLCLALTGCIGPSQPRESADTPLVPSATAAATGALRAADPIDPFLEARQTMVEIDIRGRGIEDVDVLRAMLAVPRHEFVEAGFQDQSYNDHPLPIGYGQTISQPFVVAWMTELLDLQPGEKVLEIGTGSGYQAAVLAELGFVEVYSIEIVPELAERAAAVLARLDYDVQLKQGDGYYGWEAYAPFDAIIVTAAPDHLPAPLAEQLAPSGRIVIPIGPRGGYQSLWRFVSETGELKAYNMGGVRFVPFTGEGIQSDR